LKTTDKELGHYRFLLLVAGSVYLFWWMAVHFLFPQAFNPLPGRLAVVGVCLVFWVSSFFSDWAKRNFHFLFIVASWLITFHYYYLFLKNDGDLNWIIGSYVTVMAVSLLLYSSTALFWYSLFVLTLSGILVSTLPALAKSIYFPGLVTIILQANIGLRGRHSALLGLAEAHSRFQLLFNSTFEGVLVHQNQTIQNVNDSLLEMFGYTRAQIIDAHYLCIIHPTERERIAGEIKRGYHTALETKGITRSGEEFEIEVRGKDFKYDGRPARLVTVQKIGDRKRAERERVLAGAMFESIRLRDEFISIASHELKTPLTSLKIQSQYLERELSRGKTLGDGRMSKFVILLDKQIDRLTKLVEMMLDVSKISSGNLQIEKQSFDLVELIRDVTGLLEFQIKGSGVSFVFDLPGSLVLHADRYRIEQVLENLLTNAIKYGENKPIEIRASDSAEHIIFSVKDDGVGIADVDLKRIFNRFERAVSRHNISGLGLGLYISKGIVDAHSGRLEVESELGGGSTFIVYLPKVGPSV